MQMFRQLNAAAVASALGTLALAGCQPEPAGNSVEENIASQPRPLPRLPVAEQPMDRAALLEAVAKAASAAALGRDDAEQQRRLDGKRFEIRIRFGCATSGQPSAATAAAGPFNVRFNEEDRTLRVRASPDLTLKDPLVAAIAGEGVETVEGFWMRRPWLLSDGCPLQPSPPPTTPEASQVSTAEPGEGVEPATVAPQGQRVGLAQFFTSNDSRTERRQQRAYEATKVLGEEEQVSRQGYNLVLSGRLRQLPGGRVIPCRPANFDRPPQCIVSAQFERVWIENPGTKTVLAEWGR